VLLDAEIINRISLASIQIFSADAAALVDSVPGCAPLVPLICLFVCAARHRASHHAWLPGGMLDGQTQQVCAGLMALMLGYDW